MQAAQDGSARGKVVLFLLSLLKESTQKGYHDAFASFSNDMHVRGVRLHTLTEEELDWTAAEYLVDKHEESQSSVGLAFAASLVAMLSKQDPRRKLVVCHKVLDAWRQKHPPSQAPAMPKHWAWAIASWLVMARKPDIAAAVIMCFCGLLRASEALALTRLTCVRGICCYVFILGRTKRGLEQKVVIDDVSVIKWLDRYFAQAEKGQLTDRLLNFSYNRFNYWLRKAAASLQLDSDLKWSTHSLRRGGATSLIIGGSPLKDVMLFGRWLSERSCREYLRRGEVQLIRLTQKMDDSLLKRIDVLSGLGERVFDLKGD